MTEDERKIQQQKITLMRWALVIFVPVAMGVIVALHEIIALLTIIAYK